MLISLSLFAGSLRHVALATKDPFHNLVVFSTYRWQLNDFHSVVSVKYITPHSVGNVASKTPTTLTFHELFS